MATLATLTVRIQADNTSFLKGLRKSEKALSSFTQGTIGSLNSIGTSVIKVGALVGAAMVAGTVAAAAGALKMAADFDAAMRNVNAILQLPEDQFIVLKREIIALALTSRTSAVGMANSFRVIVSAGFEAQDAMFLLEASSRAAGAGLAQADDVSKLLIATMGAYKLPVSEAVRITDIFLATVNAGLATLPELTAVLGQVLTVAAGLGVPLEEAAFSFARMTKSGLSAEETATRLAAVYTAFLKPTAELQAAMEELGFASGAQMVKQLGGVLPALKLLKDRGFADTTDKVAELFTNVRAMRGVMVLIGDDTTLSTAALDAFGESAAGAVDRARVQQYKSLTAQVAKLKGAFEAVGIIIGDQFIEPLVRLIKDVLFPLVVTVGQKLIQFFERFKRAIEAGKDPVRALRLALSAVLPPETFKQIDAVILKINDFALAVVDFVQNALIPFVKEHGPALIAVIGAIGAILAAGVIVAALTFIGGLIVGLASPIGLVFLAVAALAVAWATNWKGIRDKVAEAWTFLKPILENIRAWLEEKIPQAIQFVIDHWEAFKGGLIGAGLALAAIFGGPAIIGAIIAVKVAILGAVATVTAFGLPLIAVIAAVTLLGAAWATNWGGIRDKVAAVWAFLQPILQNIVTWLKDKIPPAIQTVATWFKDNLLPVLKSVADFVATVFTIEFQILAGIFNNVIKPAIAGVVDFLKTHFLPGLAIVAGFVKDILIPALLWLAGGVLDALGRGLSVVKIILDDFKGVLDLITGALKDLKLPDWLIGKSPTPLEMGLRGIVEVMDRLNRVELPGLTRGIGELQLQPIAAVGGAGGFRGGDTIFNQDLTIHSNARTEQVADSFEIMSGLARA